MNHSEFRQFTNKAFGGWDYGALGRRLAPERIRLVRETDVEGIAIEV